MRFDSGNINLKKLHNGIYVAEQVSRHCLIAKGESASNVNHPAFFLKMTIVKSQTLMSTVLIYITPIMNRGW